jgi:mono/diheme cytochrome c family protein
MPGAFARSTLTVDKGRLLGLHRRQELEVFLRNHYLSDELVAPVMAMLAAQASTPPLFQQRCAGCHGTAAEFARRSLALRDGALIGLPSGRRLAATLATHGGATVAERPLLLETLTRVRREVAPAGP